ncbi:hypothetical protein C7999DRAFT_31770 [Corynascus novoguineensis]|uniref:Uncharacterized protein n=1 Tax=Corynascus novoguineensis TaxID=1126955 RepID=A0AAN7CVU0_9PEZI|nr:hypothetical protein C7999DRAFT_31770 [Corynascus novoguineensis]
MFGEAYDELSVTVFNVVSLQVGVKKEVEEKLVVVVAVVVMMVVVVVVASFEIVQDLLQVFDEEKKGEVSEFVAGIDSVTVVAVHVVPGVTIVVLFWVVHGHEDKVPPLLVGVAETLDTFDSGKGALLLVAMPGLLPVPHRPELRGTGVPAHDDGDVGAPVTVRLVNGYGAEELLEIGGAVDNQLAVLKTGPDADPAIDHDLVAFGKGNGGELGLVAQLVGAVTPPDSVAANVVVFGQGKGGEGVAGALDAPVGPVAELEFLQGKGGTRVLDTVGGNGAVPQPAVPVGPTIEELLTGYGGVCTDVRDLVVDPCTLVPSEIVLVGQPGLVELEMGNGAVLDPVDVLMREHSVAVGFEKLFDGPVPQERGLVVETVVVNNKELLTLLVTLKTLVLAVTPPLTTELVV